MTDITAQVNAVLKGLEKALVRRQRYSLEQLDEFLQEAYRIASGPPHARIADLTNYLKANRAAYLSTTHAPRAAVRRDGRPKVKPSSAGSGGQQRPLTDAERAEIDAHSKTMLRQLNGAITGLDDAEKVRRETAELMANRKRDRAGLGALGRWAAGGRAAGAAPDKTAEEVAVEARDRTVAVHREGVIWLLRKRLGEAGRLQAFMIETRLQREEEKAKSVLYKARAGEVGGERIDPSLLPKPDRRSKVPTTDETSLGGEVEPQLSEEQMQVFAEENQGMLRHLGQQLDQVRAVHRSLEEISQLQTSLMSNLESQNAHIDQLVQDSFFTEENVGRGNKELKRASERASTARMLYHGTWIFCAFLVTWDLIF